MIDCETPKLNGKRQKNSHIESIDCTIDAKRAKYECPSDEQNKSPVKETPQQSSKTTVTGQHQYQSPKKRLQLQTRNKFEYGNYNQYYGYRNRGKDHHDIRLDVLETQRNIFNGASILDIGCNSGLITIEMAKRFSVKSITGIDIDRSLINQANKTILHHKKAEPPKKASAPKRMDFPFNIHFVQGNYVLQDDVLLEIEEPQFDIILCLSVTKWIHLNFGDAGLKQAFRRMFLQLQPGGCLILEAQPFKNYGRRKKITETIFTHYKSMKFFPKDFTDFLLGPEIGFAEMEILGVPEHSAAGFKRPIQLFTKR